MLNKRAITMPIILKTLCYTRFYFPWKVLFSYWKHDITYPISPAAQATTPSVWSSSPAMWSMKDRINSTLGCTSITSATKEREGQMNLSHIWQDYTPFQNFQIVYSHRAGVRLENKLDSYIKLFFLRLRCHSSSLTEEADSLRHISRYNIEGNGTFPLRPWS